MVPWRVGRARVGLLTPLVTVSVNYTWVGAALGGSVPTVSVTLLSSFNVRYTISERPRRLQELSIGLIH